MLRPNRAMLVAGLLALSSGFAAAAPATIVTNLKLRTGPGLTYEVVTTMPAGALIDAAACANGWCQVLFAGMTGYADARYIGFGAAVAPAPVVVAPPVVVPAPVYVRPYPYRAWGPGYYRRYYWR
jgi:uncharacterized protein YraI